ncbi:hypothetical protein CTH30272_04084 [Allocatenococcus thiocycli]|nr:hypothetical protein CTH30272_04084 [Catenococcus thiocycli]
MSQELVDSVNKLTGETTKLLLEYTDSNTTLKNSAASAKEDASKAAMSESAAASSNTEAKNAELAAKAEADRAELAATQAEQVTGLETVEQAVSQALADGGYTWRTEADMIAMREQNNAMFAASGFVHFGKGYYSQLHHNINDGLFTYPVSGSQKFAAVLNMGRLPSATSFSGSEKSKSNVASVNIAGFTTDLQSRNDSDNQYGGAFQIKLPPAEAGTRVYDSATGVSIDYAKEVDPKYGDVAPGHNEAVARAFEGVVKNGDFRFGDNGSWVSSLALGTIDETGFHYISEGEDLGAVTASNIIGLSLEANVEYILTLDVIENENNAGVYIKGSAGTIDGGLHYKYSLPLGIQKLSIVFSEVSSDSGISLRLGDSSPASLGKSCHIKALSLCKATTKVVTNRVDMFGFEGFLEQVTPTNPFVYKHGLIQSQATDIDGIATASSNRPDSYYAVYDGDTTSRGKGVNFLALSTIEQDQIANNPKNHIYRMANGDIVQWRIRQRTIAGAGNGDWDNIDPNRTDYMGDSRRFANFGANKDLSSFLMAQGKFNLPNGNDVTASKRVSLANNWVGCGYGGRQDGGLTDGSIYKLVVNPTDGIAYNGECYFLVCGTVSRLNQGAYHPTYNPLGTRKVYTGQTGVNWYQGQYDSADTKLMFKDGTDTEYAGVINGRDLGSGYIGAVRGSGRQDQYEYYDAIYAGQVHDMRMSAWGVPDYSKALTDAVRKDVAGVTRGKGSVPFTRINAAEQVAVSGSTSEFDNCYDDATQFPKVGDTCALEDENGVFHVRTIRSLSGSGTIGFEPSITTGRKADSKILFSSWEQAAEFDSIPWVDVVGHPNAIAEKFPHGVLGQWIPFDYADGTKYNQLELNRKMSSSVLLSVYHDGESWLERTLTLDEVTNKPTWGGLIGNVELWHYETLADFTELDTNSAVVGELGDVIYTGRDRLINGNRLHFSLIGTVGKWDQSAGNRHVSIESYELWENNTIATSVPLIHAPINYEDPQNESDSVKALPHLVEKNGQLFVQYHATQLVNNGTDWGDDSKITIVDNESTKTDDNGNVVKVVTHTGIDPIGWVKNEI